MKKNIISFFAVALSFGCFAQQFNLGKVSFATDSIWVISGNGISQIWSDAVQTDSCSNKTTFNGSIFDRDINDIVFFVDCRSNPNYKGDLFSWLAVSEFKDVLCPYPWRVPTKQDFVNLNIALGGIEYNDQLSTIIQNKYLTDWGATYGGYSVLRGSLWSQNNGAFYWSQSEIGAHNGYYLNFEQEDDMVEELTIMSNKGLGLSLRCVRDN